MTEAAADGEHWTGGLPPALDWMLAHRPEDPEMRESASIWLFEENGGFALPRNGIEAQGAVWDHHRFDCNFAFPGGRVPRESARGETRPALGADGAAPAGMGDTLHNQQSGVRYRLDGMEAMGMIERSSPGEQCTIAT